MKITGYSSIESSSGTTKRSGTAPAGTFANLVSASEASETSAAGPASDISATAALNNLLLLQEINEEEVRRKKLLKKGYSLLESLEQLRSRLLVGSVSPQLLLEISRQISEQKQLVMDPRINEIIEDIELRAAVELAKFYKALEEKVDK